MATPTFYETGGDATGTVATTTGAGFYKTVTGITVETDFAATGHTRSLRIHPSAADVLTLPAGVVSDAGARISFRVYFAALPTVNTQFLRILDASNALSFTLRMQATGRLQLVGTGVLGNNGSTLVAGQWYQMTLAYTIASAGVNRIETTVNGVSDISVTNGVLNTATTGTNQLQFLNQGSDVTFDARLSDIYVDNGSTLDYPGNIYVTGKRAVSNGTSNGFTTQIGAGGSGYGTGHAPQVNEIPQSQTNGWSITNTTVVTEEYNVEGASVGYTDITGALILDWQGWVVAKNNSAVNSPVHHVIVNGVQTAIVLNAITAKLFSAFAGSTSLPPGTGADVGIDAQYTTTGHLTSLFEAGVIIAYLPLVQSTKTETGVSRITAATLQTETGVARIQKAVAQTESGVARITASTPKTETGVARVTASTSKTETGVARIQKAATKTESGLARITAVTPKTVTGLSRITASTPRTETGVARITATTQKTETGLARLQQTSIGTTQSFYDGFESGLGSWTAAGSGAFTQDSGQAYAGTFSGKFVGSANTITATTAVFSSDRSEQFYTSFRFYQTGNPSANAQNFQLLNTAGTLIVGIKVDTTGHIVGKKADSTDGPTIGTITSNAWHQIELWYDPATGLTRILIDGTTYGAYTNSSTGVGWAKVRIGIINAATWTTYFDEVFVNIGAMFGKARITAVTPKTETGLARITATTQKTETGVARIQVTTTKTETGKASIGSTTTKTVTAVARVTASTARTESGVARITATTAKTESGVARIQVTTTKTETGVARVTVSTARTETGVARVTVSTLRAVTGAARITATTQRTETGIARITATTPRTETGKARITISTPRTESGVARVQKSSQQTVTGVANLLPAIVTTQKTVTGVAKISAAPTTGPQDRRLPWEILAKYMPGQIPQAVQDFRPSTIDFPF